MCKPTRSETWKFREPTQVVLMLVAPVDAVRVWQGGG